MLLLHNSNLSVISQPADFLPAFQGAQGGKNNDLGKGPCAGAEKGQLRGSDRDAETRGFDAVVIGPMCPASEAV